MRRAARRRTWFLGSMALAAALKFAPFTLLAAGCGEALEVPQGPDLAPLVARYDGPTAELRPEAAPAISRRLDARLEEVARVEQLDLVRQLLDEFSSSDTDSSGRVPKVFEDLEFVATARLHRPCQPSSEGVAGALGMTTLVRSAGLDRGVWGRMDACRFAAESSTRRRGSELTGEVSLRLDGDTDAVPLRRLGTTGYVILFVGDVLAGEGTSSAMNVHFRYLPPDRLALLLDWEDGGSVVASVPRGALDQEASPLIDVALTDAAGTWTCLIDRARQSGSCEDAVGVRPPFSF